MTKRKRAENESSELPHAEETVDSAVTPGKDPAVGEGSSLPVGTPVPEAEALVSEGGSAAEVAAQEELGPGPFWALLVRAGYTLW